MNQKTRKPILMCKTCNTTFATVKETNEHHFSLMHHIRLDQAKKGTVSHSCSLCCLHIGGLKNYVAHLDGKRHKANLAKIDTLVNKSVLKNKRTIKQKSGLSSTSLSKKQDTINSNQIKEVSSVAAKPNNKNDASFNKTGNDQIPVHVTSHTSNNCDFSGMQHWTEHNNSDFSSDDYYGGWNFSSTQYQNYPQFYTVNNWDQQNYNNYWANQQSLWYNGQLNEYPQENHDDVQHSFDTNNCKSTQNRYFESRNKIGTPDSFNRRFNSKENCNSSNTFRWYKRTNEKSTSLQTSRSDKSLNGVNSQVTQNVSSKNKYHEENVGNYNFSNNKHNASSKATVKHPYDSIASSGTSNNGTVVKKARLNKANFSYPKSGTRNVNKSNDNITVSLKERTLLKQKSKSVVNKIKPTSKQDKLNLPRKNIKVSKTIDQKHASRWNKLVPLNKHIKFSIFTDAKNTKVSVSSATEVNVVAGIKDSNYTTSNLQSDRREDTERNNSKQQLDETLSVLHCTKLHKLSQILEESKLDFCPFDKELINKLVNFPRSRKEQLQLGKWIQEHSRTKKKLTLPRFNLQLVSSQNAKNQHEESSDILHSVVSEVVNNLQEDVIDSLLLAIKNAEGSILQNTEDNKNEHAIENPSQNFPIKTEKNKDLSPNLHSGQLSYAEKIQWLQNWITEAYKPQTDHFSQRAKNNADQNKDRDQCLPCSSEVSREKNTDVHSFQTSNFNKVHTVSERSISSDDTVKDTFSVQSDGNKSSSKAAHNENFSEIPTNSVEVKQEVLSENEDSTSSTATVENDNNLISKSPVSYPQNTKHLASVLESNFQVSATKHASPNSPTENCRGTKKHMPQFSLNSLSNASSEVQPSGTASINVPSENQNLPNIIKTEPENTYDDEAVKTPEFSHNVGTNCNERDSEKISFSNTRESVQSDGNSDGVSFDTMVNSFLVDSSSNSFTINHVKEMLNKNKTLLQQITEVLNSHAEHSNTTESFNENLIQEILTTSQKEEELRLLGSKIERIISYFFRFAQEWKDKRTQAFYEEMRLRTRRIQLLERLKGQYPSTQNSPDHSKAADNLSGHTPPTPRSEASIPDQSNTSIHSHSRTVNINSSSVPENESKKVPDFTGDKSNHPIACSTQNTALKGKDNCVDKTNKKTAQETKKRPLSCDNNPQSSSDTADIRTASASSGTETSSERIRHKRGGASAEGVDSAPRTLAEENERFWMEMENWLQDMGCSSSSPGKQEQFSQETEPEAETWPEHIPIPSSDCSVKYASTNSSQHQGTSFIKETAFATEHVQAHKTSVLDIKVYNGYLYSCSSDATAKRFDLKDPTNVVLYNGHQKTVTSLQITDFGNNGVQVFTSSMDGHLRCFDNASGRCLNEIKIGFPIICTTEDWGKLYLGLPTGVIALYSLTTKNVIDYFQCSKCAISYIATSTEGAQKILCVASYDGAVTIWDASTGLLLRCLEGQVKPPCTVKIAGDMVYTSSTNMTVLIHNLSSGKLQKILNWPTSATGLHVMGNYIISCSYDGMVRCYTKKEWILHSIYYGAGKSSILCMCIFNDWVFTGNRHGLVDAFRFNPSFVVPCQYGKCYFRFGRLEDLSHHLKTKHFSKIDNQLLSCAWRGCDNQFSLKTSNQEKEDHVLQHVKSSRPILTDTCT